ncbi:hypothetical protein GCM10011609_13380 [Lentzea pudingi]|uniref:Uncharacterized protein n=1 Tax=Lentzea pudingi TaxID=1789439 RepID=A0ABQ2HG40_9PSEU|nr:hypothetical protein GCM10011609_13380 [Lentzea pudingi]
MPNPSSVEIHATYPTAPTPLQSRRPSALMSSVSADNAKSGSTATALTHTMNRTMSAGRAYRISTFDTPQHAAAATSSANPSNGELSP